MDADARAALELPAILERLAATTATDPGAALARALEPSPDETEVRRRQASTTEAVALLDGAEEPALGGVADVRDAAARAARDGVLEPHELRAVATTVRVAVAARAALEQTGSVPVLWSIAEPIEASLVAVSEIVDRAVEPDGTDLRDSASPRLRSLRRELRGGAARVREELERVARSSGVRDALQETFSPSGAAVPCSRSRAASRAQVPGIVHDASGTGQTIFVEPLAVVELNNRLAEAAAEAREEVERILRELSGEVAARAEAIAILVGAAAELDLALARGVLSRGWGGAPVEIADVVRLRAARHPLLDRATAVPIDLVLDGLRALVISGPNTGGKTVALKTLGLAALLHQCGLRPPAAEATLPVFDHVLADIGDRQSIEMSLSTFSGHLRTLVEILAAATGRSLVLLDEVAAGTDPEEGSALAQALVGRLADQARLTVVTTHYAELKEWASAADGVANAATGFDPETDEPLYRLELGRPGGSQALRIAERLGLDHAVVEEARSRIAPERLRVAELLAEAEAAARAAVAEREAADEARARAARRERELADELARLEATRERARHDALAAAERELAEARAELAALRDELRRARRTQGEADRDRVLGRADQRVRRAAGALGDLSGPLPQGAPLAEGDPVEAPDVGVRGTIVAIRDGEAEVVGAAGQRVRIPVARLRAARERAPEERRRPVQVRSAARGDVSDQLDVRGLTAHEAREGARRLVDEAALAGLGEVRIVHGRGGGVLRAAVRDELARHPLVDRHEPDAGDGATIAHLG